jgi:hypothetical protein
MVKKPVSAVVPAAKVAAATPLDQSAFPPLPKSFEEGTQYEIKISKTIDVDGMMVRPSHDRIVVDGAFANTIKDSILAAKQVK